MALPAELAQLATELAPFVHPALVRRACADDRRGLGVFVTQPLPRGELLLAARPLAAVRVRGRDEDVVERLAELILERLEDPNFAETFWSLSTGDPTERPSQRPKRPRLGEQHERRGQVLRIIAANARGWPSEDEKGLGLWQWHAYMNHAAPMEATCSSVFLGDVLLLRTLCAVEPDEELTNSYCALSAKLQLRRQILRHCGVPLGTSPDAAESEPEDGEGDDEALLPALRALRALRAARAASVDATAAVHGGADAAVARATELWRKVVDLAAEEVFGLQRPTHPIFFPMRAELLQLQLRAARGLGDMAKVAELHQAMAKSLAQEQPMNVEVLAHWIAHLRAVPAVDGHAAVGATGRLTRFWLGRRPGLKVVAEWMESCGLGPRRL
ncbi:unnamed protein product [Durusdinium trenchii]|uniref:SET domain-containing protein n=2 Tax=Durusdinium trenchii TaxID=1381693 RepID=A0ABP0M6U5_9DINO